MSVMPDDIDHQETQDWLDSLTAVIREEGAGRAEYLIEQLMDLARQQGCSVLFSTHDPLHALQIATHTLLLLPEGKWRAGPTDSIVTEDNLSQAYGLPLRKVNVDHYQTPFIAPLFSIRR